MCKWLLLVVVLLLASLAGDVFLVHHHLTDISLTIEHAPPQYAPALHDSLTGALNVQKGPLFALALPWPGDVTDSTIPCFCGWHNSAYLEEVIPFIVSIPT